MLLRLSIYLAPLAGAVSWLVLDLSNICSNDPPPMPQFSATDWLAVPGGVLNPGFPALLQKVEQALTHHFWFDFCHCTVGSLTASEQPIPLPPQTTQFPTPSTSRPCFQSTWQGVATRPSSANLSQFVDMSPFLLPTDGLTPTNISDVAGTIQAWPIPAGATHFAANGNVTDNVGCPGFSQTHGTLFFWSNPTTQLGGLNIDPFSGQVGQFANPPVPIPAGATLWFAAATDQSNINCGAPRGLTTYNMQIFCGNPAGQLAAACCTDPVTLQLLRNTFDLVNALYLGAPKQLNSYAESTVHPIQGTGSIGVQATALAVKFLATALPLGRLDQVGANPSQLLDLGFLTPITTEGPIASSRLTMNPQLLLLPALTQSVGFFLAPSVQGTLTELLRGP